MSSINGDWHARGDMGWFGISDDKIDQDEWDTHVNDSLKNYHQQHVSPWWTATFSRMLV